MTHDHTITLTLSVEQLLAIPFAGCCHLLEAAAASGSLSAGFIAACHCAEAAGRARWPVLSLLSTLLVNPPKIHCAACDRGDYQLGHAEGCPKA